MPLKIPHLVAQSLTVLIIYLGGTGDLSRLQTTPTLAPSFGTGGDLSRKKERKLTKQRRDGTRTAGPHLHEQDFGRTIRVQGHRGTGVASGERIATRRGRERGAGQAGFTHSHTTGSHGFPSRIRQS